MGRGTPTPPPVAHFPISYRFSRNARELSKLSTEKSTWEEMPQGLSISPTPSAQAQGRSAPWGLELETVLSELPSPGSGKFQPFKVHPVIHWLKFLKSLLRLFPCVWLTLESTSKEDGVKCAEEHISVFPFRWWTKLTSHSYKQNLRYTLGWLRCGDKGIYHKG